jgi:hypothetical protein
MTAAVPCPPLVSPAPTGDDDRFRRAYLGLFGFALGLWMMGLVTLARGGLERPWRLATVCIVLLGAASLVPALLPVGRRGLDWRPSALALCVLALPILAPLAGAALLPVLAIVMAAAGTGALRRVTGMRPHELLLLLVGPPAVAIYLFVEFHGRYFAHVYAPELAKLGLLSADTLFHAAVTHMIQRFGAASTGLDGLVPLSYHAGSHVWFAALGRLGGTEPLLTYPYAQLTLALPALFSLLLLAVGALAPARKQLATTVALALAAVLASDLVGWNAHFTSESQTLGLAVLLAAVPLLLAIPQAPDDAGFGRLTLLLAMVFVGVYVKVSIGAILGFALGWVALRGFGLDRRLVAVAVGLLAIAAFARLELVPDRAFAFSFLQFYRDPAPPPFGRFAGWTSPLVPTLALLLLLLVRRRRDSPSEGRRLVTRTAELVGGVTCVSLLPSLFSAVPNPEPWWFANAGHWFALPIFVACLATWWWHPLTQRWAKLLLALLLAGCMVFWWARVGPDRLVEQQTPIVRTLGILEPAQAGEGEFLPPRRFWRQLRLGSALEASVGSLLPRSLGQALLRTVEHAFGREAPRDAVIFVPPSNTHLWRVGVGGCYRRPLLVPALTGLPLIQGLPPGCPPVSEAYAWGFSAYGEDARSAPTDDVALCRRALDRGFARVLLFESVYQPRRNRVLKCGPVERP